MAEEVNSTFHRVGAKFIADKMLGRLAKWLRILGYDTSYFNGEKRSDLIIWSLREERIILSRDSHLGKRQGFGRLILESDMVEEQLKKVIEYFSLRIDTSKIFTRCVICNHLLEKILKSEVKDKVPSYVFETQDKFMSCRRCQKIYWQGTHWDKVKKIVGEIK